MTPIDREQPVEGPKAGPAYAEPHQEQGNVPTAIDGGTDVWTYHGYGLTPAMRRDILLALVGLYDQWEQRDVSYYWVWNEDKPGSVLQVREPNDVETVGDLFGELTGERDPDFPSGDLYYGDCFAEWLEEYLRSAWGDEEWEYPEPMWEAVVEVRDWAAGLSIDDLLAWSEAQPGAE